MKPKLKWSEYRYGCSGAACGAWFKLEVHWEGDAHEVSINNIVLKSTFRNLEDAQIEAEKALAEIVVKYYEKVKDL